MGRDRKVYKKVKLKIIIVSRQVWRRFITEKKFSIIVLSIQVKAENILSGDPVGASEFFLGFTVTASVTL